MKSVDWKRWNSKESNFEKTKDIDSLLIYGTPALVIPSTSIMIITYKRPSGLKRALDTVLQQDYRDTFEIVVVDDSEFDQETDNLMKIYCDKYNNIIYYRNEKNLGEISNWNRACLLCRTEWFCLLHDDDGLFENYLSTVIPAIHAGPADLGILGVYFSTKDDRKDRESKTLYSTITKFLINTFINIRKNKPIRINTKDNIKGIHTFSCCAMINRSKVIDIGGLDDEYFPSADFVFNSKMCYYHQVEFLPAFLCFQGIGDNQSLKLEVCKDSIVCAYLHTKAILETIKPNRRYQMRSSITAVEAELGVVGYHNVDYSMVKQQVGMSKIYNNKLIRLLILIYSRICWGILILRR